MFLILWVLFRSGGSGLVAGLEEKEVEREEAYREKRRESFEA